jgi:cytokinesis protein
LAVEKRRQAAEEAKAARSKAQEDSKGTEEDTAVLDSILDKLRKGENPRRARRARPSERQPAPLPLDLNATATSGTGDTADLARDMLARLQSDGFAAASPSTPTPPPRRTTRRRRATSNALRLERLDLDEAEEIAASSTGLSDDDLTSPRLDGSSPHPDVTSPRPSVSSVASPKPGGAVSPRTESDSPASDIHNDDEGEWDKTIIAAVT